MNSKLLGQQIDDLGYRPNARSLAVPFFPQRRVSVPTALWAVTLGLWPLLLHNLFAAAARNRRQEAPEVSRSKTS